MLEVLQAPPYGLIEDLGREGLRARGIPPCGAMDPESLALGNLLVGNAAGAAGLEWGFGPARLAWHGEGAFALVGGECGAALNGVSVPDWTVVRAKEGDELTLGVPRRGRFGYVLVAGGLAVPEVLGSRSTYLPGRFGGLEGRSLRQGDRLPVGTVGAGAPREGVALPERLRPDRAAAVRVVDGVQSHLFEESAWELLCGGAYTVSAAADRMGYRCEGPPLHHGAGAAIPSEPACPGAIQVPEGSAPIVLMPDGPTVGGYPKLAAVISVDLGRVAQRMPGEVLACRRVTLAEAHEARGAWRRRLDDVGARVSSEAK